MKNGWQEIKLSDLNQCTWNYKGNDKKTMKKLVENIRKNGLIENLITYEDNDGKIVALNGNHRLEALRTLEHETAQCFHMGKIPEQQAKRIAVETNETKFNSDPLLLGSLINELSLDCDIEELELTLPYSHEQIISFQKLEEFDWDKFDTKEIEEQIDKNANEKSLSKIINLKLTKQKENKLEQIRIELSKQEGLDLTTEQTVDKLIDLYEIIEVKNERKRVK